MGGCIISRRPDTREVCRWWSDEWLPDGRITLEPGVYAHFCRATDDACTADGVCFEWNVTTYDDTITPEEFERLKKKLPREWPPLEMLDPHAHLRRMLEKRCDQGDDEACWELELLAIYGDQALGWLPL